MGDEPGAFLSWYDPSSELTFTWDGQTSTIAVSNGETIKVEGTVGVRNATITRWLQWFELVCHNYTRLNVKVSE
jgi:hypothetical protein